MAVPGPALSCLSPASVAWARPRRSLAKVPSPQRSSRRGRTWACIR
ncbi:unnamed protein product [Gulo gulo]|uniref:Uncharacterized protein n=1 Tax=Gulo gulo TaxID=48420 RepID=A0A9X9LP77_GULGU|nr:unnamed protein product [Gulo gulo]